MCYLCKEHLIEVMKKFNSVKLFLLFFCLFENVGLQAQRTEMNFDRDWLFARYGLQADGSVRQEPDTATLYNPMLPSDKEWRKLHLPHDWGIEGPFRPDLEGFTGKLPWRGIGWYRKHFTMSSSDKGMCFYLDFDGAMANAEVWLNGHKIGFQPYGYTSFRVDLTPYVKFDSDNVLAVRLNTEKWGSRWYPGAGIYRHVRLVKTNPVHVAHWGVFVTTPRIDAQSADAKVYVKVQNNLSTSADVRFSIDLYEADAQGKPRKKVASGGKPSFALRPNDIQEDSVTLAVSTPKLWSLEHTNRYVARVSVYNGRKCVDRYDTPFGFRTIEFTHHNGFLLNGKRVQIKGTCNHHDLGALGAAVHTAALRRQLTILKSFGCNALRTSHNPPTPELLTLADEMGFLVMDETFDCWRVGKKADDYASLFDEWHVSDIGALVCRDRNHPSVILWSVGNEVHEQYTPETRVAAHLVSVVRRFDPTRPVTFGASYPSRSAMNGTELQVDVHGMNYAAGVYGGPDFYGKFLDKPGHEHLSGYSSESASTLSSRGEYFPRRFHVSSYDLREPGWGGLPDQEFAALERYPGICGEFVWTGFDYIGEPTPYNSDNSVLLNHAAALTAEELEKARKELEDIETKRPTSRSSYFGIVDLAGFPKDRYYLYKAHWMPDTPMVHILPHWNFPERVGQRTPVFVYTSGDEAELFLNGKSMGRKKKAPFEYRLRWDSIVYTPGELRAVAYKNGQRWAEKQVCTTGEAVRLKVEADKRTVKADGEDLVFVRVALTDEDGREVPTAENLIACTLEGPGQIVATDNGDPTSLLIFSETTRPAFNGLLLAIVKADYQARGTLRLKVAAEGMQPVYTDIRISKK